MKLYIFVEDYGDGSYYPRFTPNEKVIRHIEENMDFYINSGLVDSDGFHYKILNVPDNSTEESLGVKFYG